MNKPLILIGGGGHCKSVIEAAESSGHIIKGILDLPERVGCDCLGYEVLGGDDDISNYVEECEFIVTIGSIKDPQPRMNIHELVERQGGKLATVIASTAHVSQYAHIGEGSVILHNACVNAGAKIGKSCIINTLANIEHDVEIGDYTHISTGVMVNGDCKIGSASFVGSGSVIINERIIGDEITIGSGSIVCSDILEKGTYFGVPARKH